MALKMMSSELLYLEYDRSVFRFMCNSFRDGNAIEDRETYVTRWKTARKLLEISAKIRSVRRETGYYDS